MPTESQNSAITWIDEASALNCRVCGWSGSGRLIARITALAQRDLPAVLCRECSSITLLDDPLDSSPTDATVDGYVEAGAGISTIAEALSLVDPSSVSRFLDVGCNYGFALDVAQFLFGWEALGVEPSLAGARGAAELGLDIRHEYLAEHTDVGVDFDLILASEVVEHVPDPVRFLVELRKRLSASGTVVITTPAAEIVTPHGDESEVLGAISAGYHVFVASEQGLATLLQRAGFSHVQVFRQGANLRATARLTPGRTAQQPLSTRPPELAPYYLDRALRARSGSALSVGMSTRYLRATVATGDFAQTSEAFPIAVAAFRAAHGIRLDEPERALRELRTRSQVPWALPGAAFACGMLELLHHDAPQRAAQYFALAQTAASLWRQTAGVPDLDTVDLLFQAPYHRVLALAKFDGIAAAAEAIELGTGSEFVSDQARQRTLIAQLRAFSSIVAAGSYLPTSALAELVAGSAEALAASANSAERVAALDALYSLGVAFGRTSDPAKALLWLERCQALCSTSGREDEHGQGLARLCAAVLAELVPSTQESTTVEVATVAGLDHLIDVYWCDASGIHLEGWAHLGNQVIQELSVSVGGTTVTAIRKQRPDLLAFWPESPEVVNGGFSAYLPGRPSGAASLMAHTGVGIVTQQIQLPDHPLPQHETFTGMDVWQNQLAAFFRSAPPGPVLGLGVRSASMAQLERQLSAASGRDVVGLDIHPGIGVDVVGDAHRLSSLFPADHFAAVFSSSFLEHVAKPWLIAAECATVLKVGGLAIHTAPWIWPTHAAPNDFWRFSPEGLSQLFGPELGFEIRAAAGFGGTAVLPSPDWREGALSMPTTSSAGTSWVVAEKVNTNSTGVSWPYHDDEGAVRAAQYPLDGLNPGGQNDVG